MAQTDLSPTFALLHRGRWAGSPALGAGVAMSPSVLNSDRAIAVNIEHVVTAN